MGKNYASTVATKCQDLSVLQIFCNEMSIMFSACLAFQAKWWVWTSRERRESLALMVSLVDKEWMACQDGLDPKARDIHIFVSPVIIYVM